MIEGKEGRDGGVVEEREGWIEGGSEAGSGREEAGRHGGTRKVGRSRCQGWFGAHNGWISRQS